MKKYGLIGRSLSHSFSRDFFTDYFEKNQIHATYKNIELEVIEEFPLVAQDYHGFNVTIPYKEAIIPFLDELDPIAREIGAVNTIKNIQGKLIGYNTDAFGFQQSIKPFLTNKHERAMILGTGGASKAVAWVLQNIGIDVIRISRNPSGEKEFAWKEINEHMIRACKLIVNCTPIGMYPESEKFPPIPYECLSEEHLLVDLIYNPAKTKFLEKGELYHAAILNGESMLREQALRAYKIWTE